MLGDLCERYTSRGQYLREASITVALVVLSQVRRTTPPALWIAQAAAFYVSFSSAASQVADVAFLNAASSLLQLAVPMVVGLFALVLRDAYAAPARRSPQQMALDTAFGVAFALVSQALMESLRPEWALPYRVTIAGAAVSLLTVSTVRLLIRRSIPPPRQSR